jgi:hypothetical protein
VSTDKSFTCPRCGKTSHNENDLKHGWCDACKKFSFCFLCQEAIQKGDDFRPNNGDDVGLHRECLLRSVVGSIEHLEMGPHPVGACHEHDRGLTYRQNALLVDEWVAKHGVDAALKQEERVPSWPRGWRG